MLMKSNAPRWYADQSFTHIIAKAKDTHKKPLMKITQEKEDIS